MTAEAAGLALSATFRRLGRDVILTPGGSDALTVRVMERRGDRELRPGFQARGRSGSLQVDIIVADLAALGRAPMKGDTLTIGGVAHEVRSAMAEDRLALVWTVDLQPEA
jgi:hypothetical protein